MVYGVAEIAQASGERREAVAQWKFRNLLPRPDQELASGPIWFEDTIVPWLRNYDWDVEPLGSWQDRAAMKARAVSPWGDAFILAISWALADIHEAIAGGEKLRSFVVDSLRHPKVRDAMMRLRTTEGGDTALEWLRGDGETGIQVRLDGDS